MLIMECDRCKKEYRGDDVNFTNVLTLSQHDYKGSYQQQLLNVDYCEDCVKDIIEYMQGDQNEKS